MGFTFISLFLVNFIAFGISCFDSDWKDRKVTLKWLVPIFSTLMIILSGIVVWNSYISYVGLRSTYDATIEQYATSIEMYGDKAVIDLESAAWTDFKYQGYQPNVSKFIADLRAELTSYNRSFISKQKYHENWFFNWLIIPPDSDMKIVSMRTASDHPIKK